MDAGALYTHFCYVTMHFLCIKNTYISPIHRADLQDMSYPWLPLWELMLCLNLGEGGGGVGGGGGKRTEMMTQGCLLFDFDEKKCSPQDFN